jgi:hypothetical protein
MWTSGSGSMRAVQPAARKAAGAVIMAVGLTACSTGHAPAASPTPAQTASAAPALRSGPLGALTAHGVVQALSQAGLPVSHPVDTTAQDCPSAGCEQSVNTDQFGVKSFATSGQAERYAGTRRLPAVQTVVMDFPSTVPTADQQRYWRQVVQEMT